MLRATPAAPVSTESGRAQHVADDLARIAATSLPPGGRRPRARLSLRVAAAGVTALLVGTGGAYALAQKADRDHGDHGTPAPTQSPAPLEDETSSPTIPPEPTGNQDTDPSPSSQVPGGPSQEPDGQDGAGQDPDSETDTGDPRPEDDVESHHHSGKDGSGKDDPGEDDPAGGSTPSGEASPFHDDEDDEDVAFSHDTSPGSSHDPSPGSDDQGPQDEGEPRSHTEDDESPGRGNGSEETGSGRRHEDRDGSGPTVSGD